MENTNNQVNEKTAEQKELPLDVEALIFFKKYYKIDLRDYPELSDKFLNLFNQKKNKLIKREMFKINIDGNYQIDHLIEISYEMGKLVHEVILVDCDRDKI